MKTPEEIQEDYEFDSAFQAGFEAGKFKGRRELAKELLLIERNVLKTPNGTLTEAIRHTLFYWKQALEKETAKASLVGNDHKEVGVGENPTSEGCNGLPAADIPNCPICHKRGELWGDNKPYRGKLFYLCRTEGCPNRPYCYSAKVKEATKK